MDLCIRRRVQQAVNDMPPQYVPDVLEEEEEFPSEAEELSSSSLGESGSSLSD